jgi:hypothetical protein
LPRFHVILSSVQNINDTDPFIAVFLLLLFLPVIPAQAGIHEAAGEP